MNIESEMYPTSADYPAWCMNHYSIYFGCGPVGSIHYLYYLLYFIPAKTTHESVKARELHTRWIFIKGLVIEVMRRKRLSQRMLEITQELRHGCGYK